MLSRYVSQSLEYALGLIKPRVCASTDPSLARSLSISVTVDDVALPAKLVRNKKNEIQLYQTNGATKDAEMLDYLS